MNAKNIAKRTAISVFAVFFWIFLWFLIAEKLSFSLVLPSPKEVFPRLFDLMRTWAFYRLLFTSFLRVMTGFLSGAFLGFFLGCLSYYLPPVQALISPLMAIVRATPVASFILVVLFWMERDFVPSFISLLMVLPIVWQNTVLGFEKRDRTLTEMAKVYRIGKWKSFLKIDLPQIVSFPIGAAKTGLGLAWKAGVAAEVLALPKVSVGYRIYNAKMYLETVDLYAWTLAIILLSVCLEKLLFALLSKRKGNVYVEHK